jgi:hypothetical protein
MPLHYGIIVHTQQFVRDLYITNIIFKSNDSIIFLQFKKVQILVLFMGLYFYMNKVVKHQNKSIIIRYDKKCITY